MSNRQREYDWMILTEVEETYCEFSEQDYNSEERGR